jgi:hypothetical protein
MLQQKPDGRRISETKNLGPACEADLNAVGILTAADLNRLGPQDAFIQMLAGRVRLRRSAKCDNASYLYAMYGAVHDLDWRDIPDDAKEKFKSSQQNFASQGDTDRSVFESLRRMRDFSLLSA